MLKRFKRFTEPSTWAGLAGGLAAAIPLLPPPYHLYAQLGAAVATSLAVAMREGRAPADEPAEPK